jgi:hypothetical protein
MEKVVEGHMRSNHYRCTFSVEGYPTFVIIRLSVILKLNTQIAKDTPVDKGNLEIVTKENKIGIRLSDSNGKHLVQELDAESLSKLIDDLITARTTIEPEVIRDLLGVEVAVVSDPIWRTGEGTVQDVAGKSELGVSLFLRHPGAGWQAYVFPANEAKSLGSWLMTHSANSPT